MSVNSDPLQPAATGLHTRGLLWLGLTALVLIGLYWWWQIGRPIVLPDGPSTRIACVSYAPFRYPGQNPLDEHLIISPAQIELDLKALSRRFDCVRTYSQAHGLDAVPAIAARHGMKVLMGIWINSVPAENAREIQLGIANAIAHADVLRGVIVGNEVLLNKALSPDALAAYIQQVRQAIPASIPVSTADVWEDWLRFPQIAKAVDYLTVHILPYWEDKPVRIDQAIPHVAAVYAQLQRTFPGRRIMIGETGWPSAGRQRQQAVPSLVNEARYLREFLRYAATTDVPYNLIESFDQPWKREMEGTVGGYWGIFDSNAWPKFAMQGPVTEISRWWLGWLAGGAGALLFLLLGAPRPNGRERLALMLFGLASGCALAWQAHQMWYACRTLWDWLISLGACLLALSTAVLLARPLAQFLGGRQPLNAVSPRWLRVSWLFGLSFYGLLMFWDGRNRDFPLGVFELPCLAYLLSAWFLSPSNLSPSLPEERYLSVLLSLLALGVVIQEIGLNPMAWLWLGLNLALALPIWLGWRRTLRLQAQQP